MEEQLMNIEDVARLYKVSPSTVRRLIESGKLVGRKIGTQWRFDRPEVEAAFERGIISGNRRHRIEHDQVDAGPIPIPIPHPHEQVDTNPIPLPHPHDQEHIDPGPVFDQEHIDPGPVFDQVHMDPDPVDRFTEPGAAPDANLAEERIETLRSTGRTLRSLAAEPIQGALDVHQAQKVAEYSRWLQRASEEIEALADQWERNLAGSPTASSRMQETVKLFNLQYLQLQQKMQQDNRQFTLISNIMKAKHDTAKNAIDNLR